MRNSLSSVDAPAAEVGGELGAGAMEPGLDGADGPAHGASDFVVRQALLVVEDEDDPIVGSQALEAPLEFGGQVIGVVQAWAVIDARVDGSTGPGRRARRERAVRHRLAAMPRSQGRSGREPSKPDTPRRARRNESCITSSASWRWPIIRRQRPKTTP